LFKNLNTPINVAEELKDSPDYTAPVFRFLSRTIAGIGLLSLLLLFTAPADQRMTVLWFGILTVSIGGSLHWVRGARPGVEKSTAEALPLTARHE
jgi:hypothetical protein